MPSPAQRAKHVPTLELDQTDFRTSWFLTEGFCLIGYALRNYLVKVRFSDGSTIKTIILISFDTVLCSMASTVLLYFTPILMFSGNSM
jgi:hypothetical protein